MFSEGNQPEQKQTFFKGANTDQSPEKIFSNPNSGYFIDAHNMQPTSNDGNTGDLEKIKGEEIKYTNSTNALNYTCVLADTVNDVQFELWAPQNPSFPSIARANGVIVLSSVLLNLSELRPLQWDVNNSAANGEIAFTDRTVAPYVFNVQDMIDKVATGTYFTAFDPKLYQINIQSALDAPVFVELVNVGGGGGRPVGQEQYQIRYSSKQGDRTNWSHPTPLIPIMQSLSSSSDQFPYVRTFGSAPNPASVTSFAPKIRFRVTNLYDYDYIEIKRTSYNQGAGINYTSNGTVVARIDISPGEISVREYIDPSESNVNIVLSAQDESRELAHVDSAGSVRFFDRRLNLSDVKLASKESALTFLDINEKKGFPVIDNLGKAGYNDPYNHTYKRSEMRGETIGYGVVGYDCVGNEGFVQKYEDLENFTFPNRRDETSSETQAYSYGGTVRAAMTSTNEVGNTHEVFDLTDAVYKTDKCDFKNIIEKGRLLGITGTKLTAPNGVNQDCDETDAEIESHGAHVELGTLVSVSYQPFTPVSSKDPDTEGHNYIVNNKVAENNVKIGPIVIEGEGVKDYRPAGFAPNYYSMGMMVAGIDDIPSWMKSFAIVRTTSAKRVVAQGLAYYDLIKGKFLAIGDNGLAGKNTSKFSFYAPDIENGIVSSDSVNDMIENPQNYSLQFVSPLGFFSEWFSAEDNFPNGRDRCIDMISYVRMIRDNTGPNSNINPMEDPNMGIDGMDGYNYVAYDKFRNTTVIPNTFSADPDGGNKVVSITSINRKAEGRGTYLQIETQGDIYSSVYVGGHSDSNFEDSGMKNFTEPIYVVNIIRTGSQIRDNELQGYKQTTHYQKVESIVGKSTGAAGQAFALVDERWEDCISAPNSTDYGASTDRYIYIKKVNGTIEKWINVTYKTVAQKNTIISNINFNVGDVKGIYTHTNIGGQGRFFEINFSDASFTPELNSLILVRYDNTAPIRVYGGDTFIGETIFAPIDKEASARANSAETQFPFGIGLPYRDFKINPRYYTIRKSAATVNEIQDKEWFSIGFIRQLCAMFTVESRSAVHLAHNAEYPNQYYPLINYVIRPNRWDPDKSIEDNHIYTQYADDYGRDELNQFSWGGLRFKQQINSDYAIEPPIAFFSKPKIGFVERTIFPTRTMWSLPRAINVQNTPSIKTFPANNSFDIDDNQGEIKYLWSAMTGAGENLYAITERGICMLLTKKSILSDLGAGQLGYMGTDTFIGGQHWWSRDIGIYGYLWKGVAEASIPMELEGGAQIIKQAIFFINKESVFRFMDNQCVDIGRIQYYKKVYNETIKFVENTSKLASIFDPFKQQLYIRFGIGEMNRTLVFSQKNNSWIGTNDFYFDKFSVKHNAVYGHRDLKTYTLNVGDEINGSPIVGRALIGFAPESDKDKEFIRIRVNSKNKPQEISIYDTVGGAKIYEISQTALGAMYVKNYRGYEAYIGRVLASVNSSRPRIQGRLLIAEIIHTLAEDFKIVDVTVEYKKII